MAAAMSHPVARAAPTRADVPRAAAHADEADNVLAARAAAGDVGAFDAIVTLHTPRVFRMALHMLGERGEAEDLTQEVFVAVHHALGTFRGDARLSTWIFRITRNRCLNRLKALKRRSASAHVDIDDPQVGRGVADVETEERGARGPGRTLERAELRALLERHLRALPEEQRTLVVLRDLEELSYEEIVEVTGLPLGTVKSRLHRARLELAARLGPHLDLSPST